MISFVKKFLGIGIILQLAIWTLSAQTHFDFGSLPLWFEAGQGGADASAFVSHGRDSQITISTDGAEFELRRAGRPPEIARMEFVGASAAAVISGGAEMPARINYLTGNDPARWRSGLAAYGQVRVNGLYPGINLVYYGNQERLEYDFDLAPGARPETVAFHFAGAEKIHVNAQGELVVQLGGRQIIQHQPAAYQTIGGTRHRVQAGYKMLNGNTVAFAVGQYDSRLPLVIDPVLSYSTFFGGNNNDTAFAVAFATNDNSVYIAGETISTMISSTLRFATPGAFQTNFQGGGATGDAFVAKFHDLDNPAQLNDLATNLVYCTYVGGNEDDIAEGLAVDALGHAFIAGATDSTNFPVKNAVVYQSYNGSNISGTVDPHTRTYNTDAFVTELETNGASLVYSTYLGGQYSEAALGIALDSADDAYVTGYTYSTNFPVTPNAWQPRFRSVVNYGLYSYYQACNAFVSEIAAGGKTLNYSTYLGGTNVDYGFAIACNDGLVAVAGLTCSSNFPTLNPVDQAVFIYSNGVVVGTNIFNGAILNGLTNNQNNNLVVTLFDSDAFVTLFPISGSTLTTPLYSTFLGGTNADEAYGVALDSQGSVYVVGGTLSTNYPVVAGPGQLVLPSYTLTNTFGLVVTNAFLTQLKYNGTNAVIAYSQVFGSYGNDVAQGVAVDPAGNVFVVGSTTSLTNVLADPAGLYGQLTFTNTGLSDVFVAGFQSGFSNLLYAADFGSSSADFGYGIAVAPGDGVYIVGQTLSVPGQYQGFPVFNAWEPVALDQNNGFLAKILPAPAALPQLAITNAGTNLLVTWTASPLAQIGTNSFVLQSNSNLLMSVVITNVLIDTNVQPYTTNETVVTNLVASTNWVTLTENPITTNEFIGGFTNQIYEYPIFFPTNNMRYFRLQSFMF